MKTTIKYKDKKKLVKVKKQNAKLFPMYKMFSWDLLFFYSTQYLFFTMVKGISAGEILKVNAFYPLFIIIMQMPSAICADIIGRRKSIILGNLAMAIYILLLLILLAFMRIPKANYYILAERYSKNFSTPKTRVRISFTTEITTNIIEAISLFLAGVLLDGTNIVFATLFVGLSFLMLFTLALDYMRTRIGLKLEQYDKKDIELE